MQLWKLAIVTTSLIGALVNQNNAANAQIVPDATLPVNSRIIINGNTTVINGGTTRNRNLFHSFEQFSIKNGAILFNNSAGIQNIFSRVTGKSPSQIDGIIKANGNANLFFLNPNGIIFGANARLNIGGSFLGTTASKIQFADGTFFETNVSSQTPILTASEPISLSIGSNPAAIRVLGSGHTLVDFINLPIAITDSGTGLRVQPGQTLALVGGDINLEGGILTSPGGKIQLSSIENGSIGFNDWTLESTGVTLFRDVRLSKQTLVNTSGIGGGFVQVQGRRVSLTDGSGIIIQNQGEQPSPGISVKASDYLEISGTSANDLIASTLLTQTVGSSGGGDIRVSTNKLILNDGGQISARTFGIGRGGDINITSSSVIEVNGYSPTFPALFSNISAATFDSGNSGDLTISTGRLLIKSGGDIGSATFGSGSGGNVSVNARDSVEITGIIQNTLTPSLINAATFNQGNAGTVTINTNRLVVREGGRIGTSTVAGGNAGSVTINASGSVEVKDTVPDAVNPSLIDSSANIVDEQLREFLGLPPVPFGDAGNVTINTPQLRVTRGGSISVKNDGTGDAGTLSINAREIFLDSGGNITAATASGNGGQIRIDSSDLRLQNGSITATAGGNGNGGNITINTDTLAMLQNSNITANAVFGNGGDVAVNTQGIFRSPDSAIAASSDFGIDGTVTIDTPGTTLVGNELNANPTEVPQITIACNPNNSYTVVGSGGLPPDLDAPIDSPMMAESPPQANESAPTTAQPVQLVEAQGWRENNDGTVDFTVDAAGVVPYGTLATPTCRDTASTGASSVGR
jgi:filamentous hemagglutinin family protein